MFPYGFPVEDVSAVATMDGVAAVEGAYNAYGTTQVGGDRYILNIQSLTDTMDEAAALEGTLPAAEDEVGVERLLADALGLHPGDKLTISAPRGEKSYLKNSEFTITAIVQHPSFTRAETDYSRGFCNIGDGAADGYVLMAKTAFDTETYDGCFSQLLIRGAGLDELDTFGSSYQQRIGALKAQVEALGAQRAVLRSDGLTVSMNRLLTPRNNWRRGRKICRTANSSTLTEKRSWRMPDSRSPMEKNRLRKRKTNWRTASSSTRTGWRRMTPVRHSCGRAGPH